jgi:hypothetical protein
MATSRNVLAVILFFFFVSAGLGANDDSERSICDAHRTCKFMQVLCVQTIF